MQTFQWILLFSVYVFAGINIGQLVNLIDRERNEYVADNRWTMAFMWLPAAIAAFSEYWQSKKIDSDNSESNQIWQQVQADWANREFDYPWETSVHEKIDLPVGFDGGVGWTGQKVSEELPELVSILGETDAVFSEPLFVVESSSAYTVEPAGNTLPG